MSEHDDPPTEPQRPDEDLGLEPVNRRVSAKTLGLLALVGMSAAGMFALNNKNAAERKATQLQYAADAWANLSQCLVGPGVSVGQIARTARKIELGMPTRNARLPARARLREWPYRCATHASLMTRALFDSKSDERGHRILAMVVSQAASDLEIGELHTGREDRRKYLDELYVAVDQAHLPASRAAVTALTPPAPVEPRAAPLLDALVAGTDNGRVVAQDPLSHNALRLLMGTERRICTFDHTGELALAHASCVRRASMDRVSAPWISSADDGEPMIYSGRGAGAEAPVRAYLDALALSEPLVGAYVTASTVFAARWPTDTNVLSLGTHLRSTLSAEQLPEWRWIDQPLVLSRRVASALVGPVFVALGERTVSSAQPSANDAGAPTDASASSPDAANSASNRREGVLYAGTITADPQGAPRLSTVSERAVVRGPWVTDARIEGCRTRDGSTAVVAYSNDDHATVLWAVNGELRAPVRTEGRPGVIACDGDTLRMAWFEPTPVPMAHVTTCTQTGCAHERAASIDVDVDPVIAPMGNQVLAVYSLRGGGGLRYRLAPLVGLSEARDRVIFDDSEHEGVQIENTISVFVRDGRAVVLVTSKGVAGESYAFRINPDGSDTPVRVSR